MTEKRQQNAIRNRFFIGGKAFERDPLPVLSVKRSEAKNITSSLALHVDRLYIAPGLPNILQRHEFSLDWKDLRQPGLLEHLDRLASIGQPFDVAVWKQVYDVFDSDGSNKTFYLQRRQAVSHNLPGGVPQVAFADYATRVTVMSAPYGTVGATESDLTVVSKTTSNIDSGSPSSGEAWIDEDGQMLGGRFICKMRLNAAPSTGHDMLIATYLPLYKMVIDQENPRQYGEKLVEPRGYRFVEVE
jgi:hypothetical protein